MIKYKCQIKDGFIIPRSIYKIGLKFDWIDEYEA